jgi:hypothetical protein
LRKQIKLITITIFSAMVPFCVIVRNATKQ